MIGLKFMFLWCSYLCEHDDLVFKIFYGLEHWIKDKLFERTVDFAMI